MRIATAGAGLRAGHVLGMLRAEMPEARIVGICDPSEENRAALDADAPAFPDVGEMLAESRPDLFCVFSPNSFHLEQIRLGLEAGVRVLAEKPVVATMEESFALAELLAEHGAGRVLVGLVLRYSRHAEDLRAAIADGALGPIASMEANEHIGPYHGAFFMRDWRRMTALSGGFLLEKCCHDLDICNMVAGSRPARVASFGGRRSFLPEHAPEAGDDAGEYHRKGSIWNSARDPFRSDGDIVDCQVALAEYETGASLAFHTNVNVPDEHRRFCFVGARGMAEGDFLRGHLRITDARTGRRLLDRDYGDDASNVGHYGADERMAKAVAAFLREEAGELPVSVVDALEAGIAALAMDEARASGTVVSLAGHWARLDALGLRA